MPIKKDVEEKISRARAAEIIGVSAMMILKYEKAGRLKNVSLSPTRHEYLLSECESFERRPRGRRKGQTGLRWRKKR